MKYSYVRDEGRPFKICLQEPVLNHLKWLQLRVVVISVQEKVELNPSDENHRDERK